MKLTLIRGCPGSGKSTFAHKNYRCLILENDMFCEIDGEYKWSPERVKAGIKLCRQMAEIAIANGNDVVVCNTFTKKNFISGYENLAKMYGAAFEVIRMEHDYGNVHNVPVKTLESMKNRFEDWPGEIIR